MGFRLRFTKSQFGSRPSLRDRWPPWLGRADDCRPALRPSARPWRSSWCLFRLRLRGLNGLSQNGYGGACPPARTSPPLGLGRGRWPDIGFPAYQRVLTLLSVRRVIRTAAVPRRWSWPIGSRYGVSANSACVCVRRVLTNKQKLTPFFLRHFGSRHFLSILAFYVTYFSPPAHNLRGG